jgi:sulfoxide reductase catalytic subunit YedY
MKAAAAGAGLAAASETMADSAAPQVLDFASAPDGSAYRAKEDLTPYEAATTYNNFYEFGTDKSDPARYASAMTTDPWEIKVGGLVKKPGKLHLEDILGGFDLEERIYRFRCVEAWSMVVPWIGFPLSKLIERFEPETDGKFVEFKTLYRRSEMRGTRSFTSIIDWPYREGLRMDEAMNPLTLMTVGLYGKTLPNQSGAPLRLIVPWKYGFKNIKSIVEINVTDRQPRTSWQELAPQEYGFYANVNPEVSHPRWSQAYERRLPSSLFNPNRVKTKIFNGYGEQVAGMYKGMDLARYY